ncbi:MAG: hypothetical protein NVS9B15_07690 [Acidobacteriaceae bacterium]
MFQVFAIFGCFAWGLQALSEYFSKGQYARNITQLLGGLGLVIFAARLALKPSITEVLVVVSYSKLSLILVAVSSMLLLASIVWYGAITYWKPRRLLRESQLPGELRRIRRGVD